MTFNRAAAAYDTIAEAYEHRFVDELDAKPRDRELLDGSDLSLAFRELVRILREDWCT